MIRRCLETAFKELGVTLKVVKSDGEFENADVKSFDIIVLDPWTWAAKGNTYTYSTIFILLTTHFPLLILSINKY